MKTQTVILAALLSIVSACSSGGPAVNANDPRLSMAGGRLLLEGKPFTGTLRTEIPDLAQIESTQFRDGVEHGESTVVTKTGAVIARRAYVLGIKHGVHEAWYPDGQRMSYAKFAYGRYTGQVWRWHANGRPAEYQLYSDKGEMLAAKMWRPTGQIYMNYSFKDGGAWGMPGSKLCNPVAAK